MGEDRIFILVKPILRKVKLLIKSIISNVSCHNLVLFKLSVFFLMLHDANRVACIGQAQAHMFMFMYAQVHVHVQDKLNYKTLAARDTLNSFKRGSNGPDFVEKRFRLKEVLSLFSVNCE